MSGTTYLLGIVGVLLLWLVAACVATKLHRPRRWVEGPLGTGHWDD